MVGPKIIEAELLMKRLIRDVSPKGFVSVRLLERAIESQENAKAISFEWALDYAQELMMENNSAGKEIVKMIRRWERENVT